MTIDKNRGGVTNCLEWNIANFVENCEACGKRITVHAFRREQKGKAKIVYGHCTNQECKKKGVEIGHIEASRSERICEVCGEKIVVHGFREGSGRHRAAIFGSCTTKKCRRRGLNICFAGALITAEKRHPYTDRKRYEEKRIFLKECMLAPRTRVPTRKERNARIGIGT